MDAAFEAMKIRMNKISMDNPQESEETVIDSGVVAAIQNECVPIEADLVEFEFLPELSEEVATEERPIKIADYIAFRSYDLFNETFKGYQKSSMAAFCTAANSRNFSQCTTLKEILDEPKKEKLEKGTGCGYPFIRWEVGTGELPIPFLGFPFIIVGNSRYMCSQGKDINVSTKDKVRQKRLSMGETVYTRNLARPTKKMGCPVRMVCKKLFVFPDFIINKDTRKNRTSISAKLRKCFDEYSKAVEEGNCPADQNLGYLLYVTKFPKPNNHQFHLEFSNTLNVNNENTNEDQEHENCQKLCMGAKFDTVKDMESALRKYKMDNNTRLYSDIKEVVLLEPKGPLIYKSITYKCMHVVSVPHKKKKNRRTFKQGCEMHIRFGVSEDGSQLVVKSMSEEHNHEINEETIVKEALHPDLCVYVSKLVWQDLHISIDDVKAKLEDYVLSVMFKGQQPPPRTRRQYFPSKKQVRYFMAKAKTSLNISPEAQQKLESLMERLKEARSDEKMVSNFHVQNVMSGFDLNNEESMEEDAASQSLGGLNEQNAKLLFCHQTPQQQRLMRRYNTQVIMTQISDLHSKIPFPLFCLYVQTNVDFQLVGEFICQANDHIMIEEGLQTIKEWNPGWNPKFVVVDFEDQQITAVENAFQGAFALVSDASREKAWHEWLDMESNGVVEFKEDVMKYLDAIAFSYSEETLNKAARELEESDVWKMSDKMRNWFQLNWLAQAKRWVAGYRPDDYLMAIHNDRTLSDELKMFKSIKLANKSAPLNDLIQQLIEHIVPVSKKQYELLNKDSFRLQNELYYIYPDIPNYLSNRPGKLTKHIYERLKIASTRNYYITEIHPGIFSVQGCEEPDDQLHTISYGDTTSYPSCDCEDWQRFKLPCVHLAAIFNSYPDWTWDMMSVPYRTNPIFQADWSVVSQDIRTDAPGLLIDVGTQTTGATLLPAYTPEFSLTRMNDSRRPAETPQVLANQCRGLLQQISKLQLAHHTRDSLYRLRSELKELVSIFSTAPKTKVVFPISSIPLSNKSRKQSGAQTVFEQYNVKLVTPKQVALSGKVSETTTVHTTEAVVSSHHHQHQTQQEMESDGDEVDGMYISTVSEEQIIEDQTTETLAHIPANTTSTTSTTTRKRVQSPSPFFKQQPSEKKTRLMTEDEILAASQSIAVKTTDPTENVLNATEMQFPANATLSTVIDGQTINISLDQVAAAMNNAKMATNAVEEAGDGGHSQEILTFTTNSSADISDESGAHVVENLVVAEDAGMVVAEETENENETISQQDQIKTDDESVK
uniref:SWIM-type domain-containing protein n=1 Tax=Clytia hemisphaerica TaxID=252671 RepID=A0A7M6DLZ7_9CNID